jgi:hypothetical protein
VNCISILVNFQQDRPSKFPSGFVEFTGQPIYPGVLPLAILSRVMLSSSVEMFNSQASLSSGEILEGTTYKH